MSEHTLGDGPIEASYRELMLGIADAIDDLLNPDRVQNKDLPRASGFVLMVFPFDNHQGRCNYISTARREDVVVMLREQLARFQGSPDQSGQS